MIDGSVSSVDAKLLKTSKHTWLDGSHVPYRKVVLLIYCWSKEMTSIEFCKTELRLSSKTVVDWRNFLHEVCAAELLANPVVLGGPGRVVEVDESQFSRRKNHQGRMLPEQWMFGGICRRTRECFMFTVPDRSGPTLLPIIRQSIAPGTTIMSDMWGRMAAYKPWALPIYKYSHTSTYECLRIRIFQDTSWETSLIVPQDTRKYSPYEPRAFSYAKSPLVRSRRPGVPTLPPPLPRSSRSQSMCILACGCCVVHSIRSILSFFGVI